MGDPLIIFGGWLAAALALFVALIGIGHVAERLSRKRAAPPGFDVIPIVQRAAPARHSASNVSADADASSSAPTSSEHSVTSD